jgi:hypothetical protein
LFTVSKSSADLTLRDLRAFGVDEKLREILLYVRAANEKACASKYFEESSVNDETSGAKDKQRYSKLGPRPLTKRDFNQLLCISKTISL